MRPARLCSLVVLAAACATVLGCGEARPLNIDPSRRWEGRTTFALGNELRFLVVIDDDAGANGEAMRAWLRGALRTSLEITAEEHRIALTANDPAAWQPIDWRVVVVPPSGELDVDATPLALQERLPTSEDIAAFANAVVDAAPVGVEGIYRPLENTYDALSLLVDESAGGPEAESFRAALSGRLPPLVVVASTRDDEGSVPVEKLLPSSIPDDGALSSWWAVLPPGRGGCGDGEPLPGRFTDWLEATHHHALGWSCFADLERPFPPPTFSDGADDVRCPRAPVVRDFDGNPRCEISVELDLDATCDADRGWADPVDGSGQRVPRVESRTAGETTYDVRVCEVLQLQGAQRESCVNTVACEGCGSGWCGTRVDEVVAPCRSGVSAGLRFVGGAAAFSGGGTMHVACEIDP